MNHAILQSLLRELSEAFRTRDPEQLLALFSKRPTATYAGSEADEKATGRSAMRHLFTQLLARDATYSFTLPDITCGVTGDLVWVLADGTGIETTPSGAAEAFPYRLTGNLVREEGRWRWLLLTGAEPTTAPTDTAPAATDNGASLPWYPYPGVNLAMARQFSGSRGGRAPMPAAHDEPPRQRPPRIR
jgi:ketosteroid isomerase-like protein